MKQIKKIGLLVLLAILCIAYFNYPKLTLISGYAAKNMASQVFLAKRDKAAIDSIDNAIPLIKLAKTTVDYTNKTATSTVFGLMPRTAAFHEGLGSVLLPAGAENLNRNYQPKRIKANKGLFFPYGNENPTDTVFNTINYDKLKKATTWAFNGAINHRTNSVLVVYKDHIVAEAYGDGFTKETPILGWSMTKSVLATAFGILEYQKKISVEETIPFEDWSKDNRSSITINQLLRMQSGLEWEEDYSSISDATTMLFNTVNMPQVQRDKKRVSSAEPIWNYSSGTSNLLSGILRDQFSSRKAYYDFMYGAFIDKIGMTSMCIETDIEGTFVGSSYGWATTRDWAKFGLLYLHNGNWNGTRIFNKSWSNYCATPTNGSHGEYGAHFWLNAGNKYPDVPNTMYSANGYQGQHVFIFPTKNLVVVRTGMTEHPDFDINTFLKQILEAIETP